MVEVCGTASDQRPDPHVQPAPGANPPPPSLATETTPLSRASTATTIPANNTSFGQSRSIGADSSHWGKRVPALPMILSPWRGPIQERLLDKAPKGFFDHADCNITEAETADAAEAAEADARLNDCADAEAEAPDINLGMPNSFVREQPLPRVASSAPFGSSTVPKRTYGATRSHAPSPSLPLSQPPPQPWSRPQSSATTAAGVGSLGGPLPGPNSSRLTVADLIRRELARAVVAKTAAEHEDRRLGRPRPGPLFAEVTQPPLTQPQARPPPGASGRSVIGFPRASRLDPVAAAREDMVRFNKERKTSFIENVTRRNERRTRRDVSTSRPPNELLSDDEEARAEAEARANGRWPVSFTIIVIKVD